MKIKINRSITLLVVLVLVSLASCRKEGELPEDAKWIARAGKIHFVYADISYLRREVELRELGRIICTEKFNQADYCQVYLWSEEKDVPTKLPILNRETMFAIYEMKGGEIKLKRTKERI